MLARRVELPVFRYATVEGVTDTQPKARSEPWLMFVARLKRPEIRETKRGSGFIAARLNGSGRTDANIEAVSACVLDLDVGNVTREAITSKLDGDLFVAHTTFSSTAEKPRWRIVIPYSRDATPDEHRAIHRQFTREFGADRSGESPSHLFFFPAVPREREKDFVFFEGSGALLDPRHEPGRNRISVDFTDAKPPLDRERIRDGVDEGERDDSLFRLACSYVGRGLDRQEVRTLVAEAASKCNPPFPAKDAMKKVDRAYEKYAKHTGEKYTDLGNARRVIRLHGAEVRWTPSIGWLTWNGVLWRPDEGDTEIMQRAKRTVAEMYQEAAALVRGQDRLALAKWATASESAARLKAAVELARTEPGVLVDIENLDAKPWLLCVSNGVMDLRSGRLKAARREDLITRLAPVVSNPRARAPIWDAFLRRIFDENQALIAFLRRAVGYTLTGTTMEKCLFFLYGPEGDNGKSTFIETLRALMGEYATKTRAEVLMRSVSPHKGATPEVVALRGARLVVASELSDRQRFDEAFLKDLTGGLDTIAGRNLYKGPVQFRPTAKFWLYGNHRPQMRSDDDAAWRRIYLIPFEVRIPRAEQDRALPEKLRGELPGILNWALAGLAEFQRVGGLRPPGEVLAAVAEYRSEQDAHGQFFEERCVKERNAHEALSNVYDDYREWCVRNGQHYLSKHRFGKLLDSHGFKRDSGHGNIRMVYGLKLRPQHFIRVKK